MLVIADKSLLLTQAKAIPIKKSVGFIEKIYSVCPLYLNVILQVLYNNVRGSLYVASQLTLMTNELRTYFFQVNMSPRAVISNHHLRKKYGWLMGVRTSGY